MAAAVAMATFGFIYHSSKSNLAALRDVGEGTAEEISSAVNATDISFYMLIVSIVATAAFLSLLLIQRRRGVGQLSNQIKG